MSRLAIVVAQVIVALVCALVAFALIGWIFYLAITTIVVIALSVVVVRTYAGQLINNDPDQAPTALWFLETLSLALLASSLWPVLVIAGGWFGYKQRRDVGRGGRYQNHGDL